MKSSTSDVSFDPFCGAVSAVEVGDQPVERGVELGGRQIETQGLGDLDGGFVLSPGVSHRQGAGDGERGDESVAVTSADLCVEVQREFAVALDERGGGSAASMDLTSPLAMPSAAIKNARVIRFIRDALDCVGLMDSDRARGDIALQNGRSDSAAAAGAFVPSRPWSIVLTSWFSSACPTAAPSAPSHRLSTRPAGRFPG